MLEGAKSIGAGAATIALVGAAVGIGNVLSSSIHSVARNPSLAKQLFGYAILGLSLTEAIASFAPMMAFLISSVFRSIERSLGVDQSITRPLCHCLIFSFLITPKINYVSTYRIFAPLGNGVVGFFGRFLGSEGAAIMTTTCLSFSSILSLIAFYEVALGASACYLRIAPWISSKMFDASWGFFGDHFSTIFACASAPRNSWISCNLRLNAITLICILLLIGAVGKSAHIGSHTWSPDAMEGPTPVSALIHAATTVTAGVFMIARCSSLFEYLPTALIVITFAGAMTQLGYIIFACGISNYLVSVFHLINHAFFKALLFVSAGSVIYAMSDEQDMRKIEGLASSFPFTYAMMLIDVILELAYTKYTISEHFAFWLESVFVLFTSYYSFRSLFLTFLVPTNVLGRDILRCYDAPIPMAIPLILLALGSLFVGYLAKV
ncbi:hypothetical protein M9H77_28522 [Catharanthus roseus]|uniref:Uncharacterized protein n=1 Tax=Catharanthus roseus TaxID=4058 RepID=A0ACC0AHU3_CATRO|nr:hypothetical protein M9H77_28522 [Catharanthus roseus]